MIEEEGKDGKIPALVKALRGDQVLYREAIEVLYKKGAVPMSFMQNMNPADVQLVTRLVIE